MLLFLFFNYCVILFYSAIAQIFNLIVEIVIPIGIPTEAKPEIQIHPVIVAAKISKRSIQFRVVQTFLCFLFINPFCSNFSTKNNFLFHPYFSV